MRIFTLLLLLTVTLTATAAERPNIVLVMLDDLAWSDVVPAAKKPIDTPNLDRFRAQGTDFPNAYAAAPVCSPSRAAIATGQSPGRLRLTNHITVPDITPPAGAKLLPGETLDRLPHEKLTVAELLHKAGYRTSFIGKWHLCGDRRGDPDFFPDKHGFETNLGGCGYGGPPSYFAPFRLPNLPPREGKEKEYLPDRLADEAIAFIEQDHQGKPFALFLWNYTVHWPLAAHQEVIAKYEKRKGLRNATYAAMVECADTAFGRVIAKIDELQLGENTLIVFTSDNGGFAGVTNNAPLRGAKGDLYEGGIRVPFLVRWTGKIAPGKTNELPVVGTDLYPTFLAAAGVPTPANQKLDGVNLMPVFLQKPGAKLDLTPFEERAICWHYPNYAWHRGNRLGGAIRLGNWKLIERFDNGSVELFDLSADRGEKKNLAQEKPEVAKRLLERLQAWQREANVAMPRER